jgi:hypothetical protein
MITPLSCSGGIRAKYLRQNGVDVCAIAARFSILGIWLVNLSDMSESLHRKRPSQAVAVLMRRA